MMEWRPALCPTSTLPLDRSNLVSISTVIHEHYAHTRRRGLFRFVGDVLRYPVCIWAHRLLVQNFFRRELLGRFRGSFLGVFWVLVQPIFLFSIYFFVFGFMFSMKFPGQAGPEFAVYLLSGLLVVTAFMEATLRACTVVVENGNLVKKVAFPCELLPVHLVGVATMVFLVGIVVLMIIGLATGTVTPDLRILAWPLVLAVQIVFSLGVGLALACIHVFMRDAAHIWALVGQAWMFLSPGFWYLEGKGGLLEKTEWASWLRLNPLYPIMQANRLALGVTPNRVDGTLTHHLLVASAWAIGMLVIGHALFMSRREKFADLV